MSPAPMCFTGRCFALPWAYAHGTHLVAGRREETSTRRAALPQAWDASRPASLAGSARQRPLQALEPLVEIGQEILGLF